MVHMHKTSECTAVSSVTIGFVIRLNKPNYDIDKYGVHKLIIKLTSKGSSLCKARYSNAKSYRC